MHTVLDSSLGLEGLTVAMNHLATVNSLTQSLVAVLLTIVMADPGLQPLFLCMDCLICIGYSVDEHDSVNSYHFLIVHISEIVAIDMVDG